MKLFVFGSSLTSSYWNGAATYYRGIYRNLAELGFEVTFAEPDAYGQAALLLAESAAGGMDVPGANSQPTSIPVRGR